MVWEKMKWCKKKKKTELGKIAFIGHSVNIKSGKKKGQITKKKVTVALCSYHNYTNVKKFSLQDGHFEIFELTKKISE